MSDYLIFAHLCGDEKTGKWVLQFCYSPQRGRQAFTTIIKHPKYKMDAIFHPVMQQPNII
jgi:hypothetical protein